MLNTQSPPRNLWISWGLESNRNGLLASQTYGNGQAWHYVYSDFGDLVRAYTTGGTTGTELRYFYNSEGALVRIEQYATTLSGGNGSDIELHSTITGCTLVSTERYYYDSANRATRIIRQDADGDSYECRWEYDHNNNVTNLVEIVNGQTHTTSYTYDLEQRISQFVNDGVTSGYTYDGFGRLITVSNGILSRNYQFQTVTVGEDSFETSRIGELTLDAEHYDRTYTYTYDANGNILSVSDGTNTTSYVYDSLNQLVRENNQAAWKTWVYTYDNGGNISSRTAYAYTTARNPGAGSGPNAAPVVAYYTYGDTHWGDLLTAYKGQSITYDGIGNPLNDGTWTYTWENGRQLASMTSGTTTWSYKYNADGLRTERSNGTVTYDYIYSGSQLIQMTVGTDTLYFTYDASGTPMAVDFNGTKYFYATNLQGDIIAILDTNGNAVVEYTYDAWGNILTATDSTLGNLNPLRYRGYVFDSETKFFYLQSRYYDPELGRFINADAYASTGQGILGNNMFAYCGNNPASSVDPAGNAWCKISFDAFSPFDSSAVPMAGGGGGFMGAVFAMNSADSEIDQAIDEFDRYVNNTSEATVLYADYYAFYKGKLVIRTNGERSGSFGIIFLTRETNNRDDRVEIIRHEYGHTVQLDYLGPIKYLFCIFIPSANKWGNAPYYDRPQEITANIFGGANLGNPTPAQIYDGFKYLKDSYNCGIWAWTMYDWGK